MNITSEVQTYVNSSTIVGLKCWTGRKAGPIDYTVSLGQECNERGAALDAAPAIGLNLALKMYTSGVNYWDLEWAKVIGYSGLTVDIESGAIISRTIDLAMNGFNPSAGKITQPGAGSDWWPAA